MESRNRQAPQGPPVPPRLVKNLSRSTPSIPLPPARNVHAKIAQIRTDEENTSAFRVYKRTYGLVVDLIEPDAITKARAEEVIQNSSALKEMRRVDTISLKQERLMQQFLQVLDSTLASIGEY